MKKNYLALIGFTLLCTSAFAQKINTDSLALVAKISNHQLKLAKLQNTVRDKTRSMQDDSANAQQSADNNRMAAIRLGDDAQDKKLARQADNKASDARRDSRKARISRGKLDRLNKEIQNLQISIDGNQRKLDGYVKAGIAARVAAPAVPRPMAPDPLPDTTRQLQVTIN
jgi:hypothetical protein